MLNVNMFRFQSLKLVRQSENTECGLACLVMIANYFGNGIGLNEARTIISASTQGSNFRDLIHFSNTLGLTARPVGLLPASLKKLKLPAILHWNNNHFVVLERLKGNKAKILNPAESIQWISIDEVSLNFTGAALELEPTLIESKNSEFVKLKISDLWSRISGFKTSLVQTILLSLILQVVVLISPYYMQLAVDQVLPSQDMSLLLTLAIGFGFLAVLNSATSLLRAFVLLNAGTLIGFALTSNVMRKLFRLPISWFESRAAADILSKVQSVAPIQAFLTEGAVAAFVDGLLAISTFILMLFYSPTLAAVAFVALTISILARLLTYSFEKAASYEVIITSHKEQSSFLESLRGMSTIRLFDAEAIKFQNWQSLRVDATNAGIKASRVGIWYGTLNSLIYGLETIFSVFFGVSLILNGNGFSIGMLFAFVAYKTQFISKSENLIEQYTRYKMLSLHLDRLSDITLNEEDISFSEEHSDDDSDFKINGSLKLRGVKYKYSNADPLILNNINLEVLPGEHVAITGRSGSGKSTLVKVLLGLIEPTDGDMIVDGKKLSNIGYRSYHRQVGGILQDDTLFTGTLAENISLFSENIDMKRVEKVAKLAAVHEDIMNMPMKYYSLVGDMGSALSGGQKQRIILARALYREPKILIIDEGTAHLDSLNESLVNKAIQGLGITRIVIAHRRETIRAADRVYKMVDGGLVETS